MSVRITADQVRAFRLRRHHLATRAPKTKLLDVVSDVANVHAQVMSAAELSLAARVNGLRRADVADALWERRSLVKTWTLRGTLHLVRADELPLYAAALSTHRPWERAYWRRGWGIEEGDVERIVEAIGDALDGRRMTREELTAAVTARLGKGLGERLRSGWGTFLKPAAWTGMLAFGPNEGRNVTFVRPDQWLRRWRHVDPGEALAEVARRFLRAYGPATHADFARWFGGDPPPARRLFADLGSELEQVSMAGSPAWALRADVPGLRRTRPSEAVRLLPNFDVFVVGSHPRELHVDAARKARVWRKGAWVSPVVAVGGLAVGVWEQRERKGVLSVEVEPFGRIPATVHAGIEAEVRRIGTFRGMPAELSIAG